MNDNFTTYIVYIEKVKRDNLKRKLDDEYEMEKTVRRYQHIRDDEEQKEKNRKNVRQCYAETYHNENVIERQTKLKEYDLKLGYLKKQREWLINNYNKELAHCNDEHKYNINNINLSKESEKHSLETNLGTVL